MQGAIFAGNEPSRSFLVDWLQRKAQHEQTMREQDRVGLELRPYKCTWEGCSYATTTQHNLDTHHLKHTGEKPYKCVWPGCSYAAATKHVVDTHYLRHAGEKPYKCPWVGCGYADASQHNVDTHYRYHSGAKPYSCA